MLLRSNLFYKLMSNFTSRKKNMTSIKSNNARELSKYSFLLLLLSIAVSGSENENLCLGKATCGECIASSTFCAWCSDPDFQLKDRCNVEDKLKGVCSETFIHTFTSSIHQENTSKNPSSDSPIRMTPRLVKLKMRPNEPMTFPLTFLMSKNHSVDIYFLFDASHTMSRYTKIAASIIYDLVKEIAALTSSVMIGFGSFVDKETLPFMGIYNGVNIRPCTEECVPGFSFINHMNLSQNLSMIKESLDNALKSGNIDQPEGGFDAIVQAVVCKDIIGWRQNSKKMVIMFTDEISHTAGDGKLAGIVEPNTLKCHLDGSGHYTWSTKEDYPSVAQLASVLEEHRVNLIFAITHKAIDWYRQASRYIAGCAAGELRENSTQVTSLVTENYFRIQRTIQLSVKANPEVDVQIRSSCNGNSSEKNDTSVCYDVRVGQEVTFDVTTTVKECGKSEFIIIPVGIEETLKVEIEGVCSCDCLGNEKKSPQCNNNGDLECGLCSCASGYYGDKCQCSGNSEDEEELCRSPRTSEICSGRGTCKCGICQCISMSPTDPSKIYSGQFCDCDDYSCIDIDGKMCSGHGSCKCGKCQCLPGFSGADCSCTTNISSCISSNKQICNGKGTCHCGSCACDIDNRYKGTTCEDCPTCPGMCEQLIECASCHLNLKDTSSCTSHCGSKVVDIVDTVYDSNLLVEENYCKVVGEDNCYVMFVFNFKHGTVKVQRTKECIKINYPLIIGSAVGGVLLAGLVVLLVWKVVVTLHDKREYQAFEKEKANARWNTSINPLYQQAVSKYNNPTFRPKQAKT